MVVAQILEEIHIAVFDGSHQIGSPKLQAFCPENTDPIVRGDRCYVVAGDCAACCFVLAVVGVDGGDVATSDSGFVGGDGGVESYGEAAEFFVAFVAPQEGAVGGVGLDGVAVGGGDDSAGDEGFVVC